MVPHRTEPATMRRNSRWRMRPGKQTAVRSGCFSVALYAMRGILCVTLAALPLMVVCDTTGTTGVPSRQALVFRIEGSSGDPEYSRACEVVKGLEDLYGRERYRLHQVDVYPASARRQWRWMPRWFSKNRSPALDPPSQYPPVVCSLEGYSGSSTVHGDAERGEASSLKDVPIEDTVAIGGVEDLLEFVRSSVLAGPRPLSIGFHKRSLRLKHVRHGGHGSLSIAPDSVKNPGPVESIGAKDGSVGVDAKDTTASMSSEGTHQAGSQDEHEYDYDLVVIGGGSGGLACAKEAAKLGQRVACLDFVKPSLHGSQWGLGGTCVNVGCIPKKLMHQAALLGEHRKDATFLGWHTGFLMRASEVENGDKEHQHPKADHSWGDMVRAVQNYVKGLNFKYRTDLRSKGVEYLNALGRMKDRHTVIATFKTGEVTKRVKFEEMGSKERVLSCDRVVIAVGGRPNKLDCEGGDLAISSDDLFSLKKPPGRTLIIGASYVALECAGFLTGLGIDTTVMVRSIVLRGFDQGIAERVRRFMEAHGTRFVSPGVPHRIYKTESGRLLVSWKHGADSILKEEEFDTVMAATGRTADIAGLGLEALGVALGKDGKMVCSNEETSIPGVFGLGDAVEGVPELTPTAIQAGRLLARRLFGGGVEAMDYTNVCTTVFTPLEYACCGLSEEDAIELLGEDGVEVYHSAFTPLEWQINPERDQNACYVKAICDLKDRQRVVGLHLLGPNAGEVMQGFGLGVRLGMTYDDLRQLVGIHPTMAEELTLLETTKRSGEPIGKSAC